MAFRSSFPNDLKRSGTPVTLGIAGLLIVFSLFHWVTLGAHMNLFAVTETWSTAPWTLLTYPLVASALSDPFSIIFFIFLLVWLYSIGGSVERDLGSARYAALFVAMTLLPALILATAHMFIASRLIITGTLLPLAAVTVIWGIRNATSPVMLWGIPANGKIIAILDTAMVLFTMGSQLASPIMGVFACLHLGLGYLFAANRIPGIQYSKPVFAGTKLQSKAEREKAQAYFDDVRKREKEREERERLRKLFEGSLDDDNR